MSGSEKAGAEKVPEETVTATAEKPFSSFPLKTKQWIVFLTSFAGVFSPLSSFVFYPATTPMAQDLGVGVELINIAITTYMVVSGIAPTLLGNAADRLGRRPVYILALALYFVANLGLALQGSYAGLLILRMIQSAGSSGTISLGHGVISDITTPAERGFYVGVYLMGVNVAPPFGPVLGGVLASKLGWKSIFWFLVILGGICLFLIALALPETCRALVGDGSLPAHGISRLPFSSFQQRTTSADEADASLDATLEKRKSKLPNPWHCIKLLFIPDVAIVLLSNGIFYMTYCCLQASLSTIFIHTYGYPVLEAGLIYIPFGLGCLANTVIWGKVLNWEYARVARCHNFPVDSVRGDDLPQFPLEKARLRSSMWLVVLTTLATISYGWSVQQRTHVSVPLILQVVVGFSITGVFVALGTLITDLNPTQPSTAQACANLVRCALAAASLGVLQPVIDAVGVGWCFSILGVISALCGPLLLLEMRQERITKASITT